ncbi:MAG: DegT/DnrJ/EryC1/StrS family aminotransferase [Planctomycetaceae bacterium]|nr:DegT/DnrJ/EryC1/StrS family aminotransferase [Planctomycetaceae bacterium]
MIPRHAPPFSLHTLIATALFRRSLRGDEWEIACAEMLNVRHALLLPSARAGILLAIRAVKEPDTLVVGPAYVCNVVHEAMILSGASVRFVDCAADGFLMDAPPATIGRPWVHVLSDIYGLPCARAASLPEGTAPPSLRLWDMAMTVPQAGTFSHLGSGDAALLSFGLGKCLYAGWGGALLSNDTNLMDRIRDERNRLVVNDCAAARLRHGLSVLARTTAHTRCAYALGRMVADRRNARRQAGARKEATTASADAGRLDRLEREWTEPMTPLNRKLARENLRRSAESAMLRRRQAEQYRRRLEPLGIVRGIPPNALPQSHFPICVAATRRAGVRTFLQQHGVDTAMFFPFPSRLRRADYPNAATASTEVILLPLGELLRLNEADVVAKYVEQALLAVPTQETPSGAV